jgi:hypothetical protein
LDHSHPEGWRWDFAWRFWVSRSVVGSGWLVVVGLVLLGVVLIGVCGVLLVICLLWLFCDVGVWLVNWWYGYVGSRARPLKTKRG